ncbi:hypothetical protein [Endomicrobium proavitum]|uniref:Pili assembly chaperone N-terminal domain-containing protein n=1 Tax=Endomicrobium proavitum TaxID=1408281 RepID=A0A0G3WJL9_9BACT|nr:hypothetical protein [Endomicrobium proavitum]AKL98057.1 exported protein of unknown function [Endomicrobium proavitum]
MKKSLFSVFILLFFACVSYAGLIVDPARIDIVMLQEQSYNNHYVVTNDNEESIEVTITVDTWNNSSENKDVDVSSWLVIGSKKIILAPRQKTNIAYMVKSGNLKGSVSAMVSWTYRSPKVQDISLMTSLPIYLTIDGTQKIDFEISELAVRKPNAPAAMTDASAKESRIVYTVKNNGNVPLRVKGTVKILDGKNVVYEAQIQEQNPAYAGSDRAFFERFPQLKKGKYILNVSLSALDKTVEKSVQIRVNKYGEVTN